MSYPATINSLQSVHPTLPAVLANVDLNRQHDAGTPVAAAHIAHAKAVVATVRGINASGQDASITDAIVLDAEMREVAIEQAYASARYAPANLQQSIDALRNDIAALQRLVLDSHRQTMAAVDNNRILSRNARIQQPQEYSPLQKKIPGSGHALANAVRPANSAPMPALNPEPRIGDVPPAFSGRIAAYNNADILRLITFYNEDFGIVAGDPLALRNDKFRVFISEF
ncbi:hypothetical protein BDZ89DRAFT_404192 [Hymenopellis radicata]|nr:hypothetical protein BDZ89DRAFT_404192 [Hymenopellis radicata]